MYDEEREAQQERERAYRASLPCMGPWGHQTIEEILEGMPVTYTDRDGAELHDQFTGEIFDVPSIEAGRQLRSACIHLLRPPYQLARVQTAYIYS